MDVKTKNIFGIYKPKGPTSFDIVARVRKLSGVKKVGHAGTLDPLASGVLVIGVGREATRQLSEIVGQEKEYIADIRLGMTSTTDDEEGIKSIKSIKSKVRKACGERSRIVSKIKIEKIIKQFVGQINQIPPQFSAIKVKGRRAYKSARAGKEVELLPRPVEIREIKILKYKYPDLRIKVICGKGTYIRALARDIGQELGVGGYLSDLERSRVGEFEAKDAIRVEKLGKFFNK